MKLFDHQSAILPRLAEQPRLYLNWTMGCGKTIATLAHCGAVPMPTLVLAPRAVMRAAWQEDAKHFPSLRVVVYHGAKRKAIAAGSFDILITTHETFRRDREHLQTLGIRRLVVDEASKLKSHESKVSAAAFLFSRTVESVLMLSGTPAPNCPSEWWPQVRCLSPSILGESYWSMIGRYFVPQRRKVFKGGREIEVIERLDQTDAQRAAFSARIAPHVHSLTKEECLSLPPVTDQVWDVELGPLEWKAYKSATEVLRVQLESGEVHKLKMESLLGKLRQIVGGAMYSPGDDGSRRVIELGTAKLDALGEVLDSLGDNEPVVIWAEFTSEIDRIQARYGGEVIDGRTKDAGELVSRFQRGEIRRLICHPQACGHGITLTRACYAVFYSLSFSLELWEQARARLDRAGQTRPVTNVVLVAEETVDRAMLGALKRKRGVFEAVLSAIRGTTKPDDATNICG